MLHYDPARVKFGRKQHDPRRVAKLPRLSTYLRAMQLPEGPEVVDWTTTMTHSWGMLKNDELGDCTCAAVGHMDDVWMSYQPPYQPMTDDEVVKLYEAVGGYIPGDASTDDGAMCVDVLQYWMKTGVTIAGQNNRIAGFCAVNTHNHQLVKTALWLFGGLYIGVTLLAAQQDQLVWDVSGSSPLWGRHCVNIVKADARTLTCATWGGTQEMTWDWWDQQCDECYGVLNPRWTASGLSPSGFPIGSLQSDLHSIGPV